MPDIGQLGHYCNYCDYYHIRNCYFLPHNHSLHLASIRKNLLGLILLGCNYGIGKDLSDGKIWQYCCFPLKLPYCESKLFQFRAASCYWISAFLNQIAFKSPLWSPFMPIRLLVMTIENHWNALHVKLWNSYTGEKHSAVLLLVSCVHSGYSK